MDEFDEIVAHAAAALAPEYFRLPVDGAGAVYRERVYCYELYHQMHVRWPEDCPYFLNGEVDKQQHPYFGDGGYPKPDFLVHVPGTGNNYAAIEVKPPGATNSDMRKDIGTLLRFRAWYQRALYLIYGVDPYEALERVAACVDKAAQLDALELWIHPGVGAPAERIA